MRLLALAVALSFVSATVGQSDLPAHAAGLKMQSMQVNTRAIAMKHLADQNYRQAALMLERHVIEHPEDLEATFSLAKAYYRDMEFDKAKRYISQMEDIAPNDAKTLEAQNWTLHDPAFTRTAEQRQKDSSLAVLALSVSRGELPKLLISDAAPVPVIVPESPTAPNRITLPVRTPMMDAVSTRSGRAASPMSIPVIREQTMTPETSASPVEAGPVPARQPVRISEKKPKTFAAMMAPKDMDKVDAKGDDDITEMKALMKQMMMMQMAQGSANNNPFSGMQGGMGGQNSSFINPMMMQMMQQQQGMSGTGQNAGQNAQNAQMMQQMMQQSMMQNMNNMFNQNNDNNGQSNSNGFGF